MIMMVMMENNIVAIVERVRNLIFELGSQITDENAGFEILCSIADDILANSGKLDEAQHAFLRKGLVHMFMAGRYFPEQKS